MNFTFNSEQYGTTVEINFKADTLDEIHEMFEQFLRGSGFHFISGDEEYAMHTKQESSDTSEEYVPENDMAYRPNGLTVEDDDIQEYKRPWVGLTDEEIHKIIDDCTPNEAELEELNDFAKAIFAVEAKLKERNT
jgi:hypothetical protein